MIAVVWLGMGQVVQSLTSENTTIVHNFSALCGYMLSVKWTYIYIVMTMCRGSCKSDSNAQKWPQNHPKSWKTLCAYVYVCVERGGVGDIFLDTVWKLSFCALPCCLLYPGYPTAWLCLISVQQCPTVPNSTQHMQQYLIVPDSTW